MRKTISIIMVLGLIGNNGICIGKEINKAIDVTKGKVELPSGETIEINHGTFIPTPWDRELAVRILGYKNQVKFLELEIEKKDRIHNLYVERSRKKLDETKKFYQDKYKDVYLKNIILEGPWNKYGKTILVSMIVAAASILSTWFICKNTESLGC